ncbi:hypothetical protein SEA_HFRANCETTE_44 [Streptomyces phage HFrancette]|uniref:Uncharacterized protein n=3 Tax=Ignaciovirus TaxID=3152509 RepID=A0A9E7SYR0_9CAUD|nr:hypothetical protein QEN60_gp43 [Streptomyces phage Ignacio]YP_010756278.1 hypothetical protein QEN62_gp42 [Streptomyces phage AxeJC]YP_010756395.1 hypothetical protein QEN64_gp44 [Streptomyces phage HFrancette]QKN87570.1 hypothetical protein SEA_IGNACIO_43 [Streptomyces phage Ignacio]URC17964.1 hypothetical protein SEA_AXEJC_42 [Streptomyces phage AxeJC]UTN92138.1 hypothetical protein SEA_HFRANCETTE_44 [Streptomyces phage HFrancette]
MNASASLAIIRAALEDAPLIDLMMRPGRVAQRIAAALLAEGWTITPTPTNITKR